MIAMRFSKGIVLLCITATTAYTVAVLVLCFASMTLPPAELTVGVFGMYSVEFGAMAAIKRKELHVSGKEEEGDNGEAEE